MSSKCPKCGEKISPFYLKQECPKCGVNLMYYRLEERLEEDARQAAAEVARVEHFKEVLKKSTVKTPLHVARLVLFFTPLASMCLPMYYAGHKLVSLIGIILSIVNHGLAPAVWPADYLFAVLAVICVIVVSLAVIINSLFSSTEHGGLRNLIFSLVNTAVFGALSVLVCANGGAVKAGFFVTAAIYAAVLVLHYFTDKKKSMGLRNGTVMAVILVAVLTAGYAMLPKPVTEYPFNDAPQDNAVVSFNLAAPWGTPFDGTAGKERKARFVDYIENYSPVLIGTQELNSEWLAYINERMPDYESYAVKRGGDSDENRSEMNGIFWKKSRFEALETNTFWLSETPDKESRYTYTDENGEVQEAGCNRICSYAILKDKERGGLVAFLNTHLDNSSEEAMNYGAKLILNRITALEQQYDGIAVVLTGDFNQTAEGPAYRTLAAALYDTTDDGTTQATWQDWGYTDTGNGPIDFIFTNRGASDYSVLNDLSEGYVSDHYGVLAVIEF